MSPSEARQLLEAADAQREALRAAVEAEALPLMRAAWEASLGRIEESALLGVPFHRVGLVERRTDKRGTFDLVWLEVAAYRPFVEEPDVFLWNEGSGWRLVVGVPKDKRYLISVGGVIWLRETGKWLPNKRYYAPWVHCGINQRLGSADEGRVDHMTPDDDVSKIVYPAAVAWLLANGGPVYPPESA